jgi:hypothetical protein
MVTIAGGIILAIILLAVFGLLIRLMFIGFEKGPYMGCFTAILFGLILIGLVGCLFG